MTNEKKTDSPPPESPVGHDFLSNLIFRTESILSRIAALGWLTLSAIFLSLIAAVLFYALLSASHNEDMVEAGKRLNAAVESYESGKIDESLQVFSEIRGDFPGSKIARLALYYEGAVLFRLERDERSLEIMEEFLSDTTDEMLGPDVLFMAGVSSFRLERWEGAITYFEQLVSEGLPAYEKRALPLLGTAYMKTGNRKKAEEAYRKYVLSLPPVEAQEPQTAE